MLHPSYSDLMAVVNSEVEPGEQPVVQSRYSIVMATSKRARQIIEGEAALVDMEGKKPLSMAVEELYNSKIKIVSDEDELDKIEEEAEEEAEETVEVEDEMEEETEETEETEEIEVETEAETE